MNVYNSNQFSTSTDGDNTSTAATSDHLVESKHEEQSSEKRSQTVEGKQGASMCICVCVCTKCKMLSVQKSKHNQIFKFEDILQDT